ncbi:dephospho-CoA kinase CoaE [Melissococcus plutonius]|uniref:dephospho-CoA kinase n=1 Tax=Melissococcus plutonius TaxID=33970 RepID=UPI00065E04AE|nr:dephospho-CoA kinase [Melissococcus plutonius]AIM25304.1 dephospho-CoA kinase CoaE [Melissococcus plutonius S1]KMT23993.1 dephospho-CoA kinase CoaE [Melissococcus plutonius]KMT24147.1 dephospho-CoA kinase CoaE [Melissococcus plutonius]KMT25492.1 dephospho-CoA kinase CoaE [Melissococcus plutonius]KMT28638.1 dephospho-CoA kinase CoaE [Melissococcus plutonius]
MQLILGITGGIATGKSTVVNVFKKFHYPVIDGDCIAKQIVEKGQPALTAIEQAFGKKILKKNGELDRKLLGELIFHNKEKRRLLDQRMAPFLKKEILRQIAEAKTTNASLIVVDLPLLYEGHYEVYMEKVAVVYTPESIQQQRLMKREQLTKEEARKRIQSQWSIEEKKKRANILFDNSGSKIETEQQVVDWLQHIGK